MKRVLLLFVPLVLIAQDDPAVKNLVEELQSSEPQERDAATRKLVDMGEAIKPAMKKLRESGDPELKARAESILREIERRKQVAAYWAPPKLVTATFKDTPIEEALAQIQKQTGYTIKAAAGQVSGELKNVPFLKALHELCAQNKGLGYAFSRQRNQSIAIFLGATPPTLKVFRDQYCVELQNAGLRCDRNFVDNQTQSTLSLQVCVHWEPAERPVGVELELAELTDQAGRSLKGLVKKTHPSSHVRQDALAATMYIKFTDPNLNVEKIGVFKGAIHLSYPNDVEVTRLPVTADKPTKTNTEFGLVEVSRFEPIKDNSAYRVKIGGPKQEQPQGIFEFFLIDRNGKEWAPKRDTSSTLDTTFHLLFDVKAADAAELVIKRFKDLRTESVPFEFKDIPLE